MAEIVIWRSSSFARARRTRIKDQTAGRHATAKTGNNTCCKTCTAKLRIASHPFRSPARPFQAVRRMQNKWRVYRAIGESGSEQE